MTATPLRSLQPAGRLLLAIALLGLGVEHVVFRQFVTGRAPDWPAAWPGQLAWACASGALVFGAGLALLVGVRARVMLALTGAAVGLCALLPQLPGLLAVAPLAPAWTGAGKALTFFGGAFAVAATLPPERGPLPLLAFVNRERPFVLLGRLCLGAFLLVSGLQHFQFLPFVASLIPAWFPGDATWWSRLAGVALIVAGVGLWIRRTAPMAALLAGLMVFSWVWIVHLPRLGVGMSDQIAIFEALGVSGIAFAIAGAGRAAAAPPPPAGPPPQARRRSAAPSMPNSPVATSATLPGSGTTAAGPARTR